MSSSRRVQLMAIGIVPLALLAMGLWLANPIPDSRNDEAEERSASATPTRAAPSATFTLTASPTSTPTPTLIPTDIPRPPMPTAPAHLDNSWQQMPVVPEVSPAMKAVYARGLALGNEPHAFAKVGDCNTEAEFFLTPFDQAGTYRLGPYADLQAVIDNFAGSFSHVSVAARTGFGPGAMFDSTWVDPNICLATEGPLACEYRLQRPSLALISLGTHYPPLAEFESRMRAVIEFSLDRGVVPILATKVDVEGGDRVNAIIVYLAQQYEVPVWNFWRAAQPLYNHGQPDGIHFTWASNFFDSPYALRHGWPVRNLTALQTLQAVWQAVSE